MSQNRTEMTRREFLRNTAIISGTLPLASLASTPLQAGQTSEPRLGAQLIGRLEGPELVLDPTRWPKKVGEAPMLAELVRAGKLPPAEKRVPEEPMVIKPLHSIGKYGGTWRRAFTGPGDGENGNRIVSTDKILFWDFTGTKIMPCVARDWKMSDDGRIIAILLLQAMPCRWTRPSRSWVIPSPAGTPAAAHTARRRRIRSSSRR